MQQDRSGAISQKGIWEAYGKHRRPKFGAKPAEWDAKKSPVCRLWFRRGRGVPGTGERLVELERARIGQTLLSKPKKTAAALTYVGRASTKSQVLRMAPHARKSLRLAA